MEKKNLLLALLLAACKPSPDVTNTPAPIPANTPVPTRDLPTARIGSGQLPTELQVPTEGMHDMHVVNCLETGVADGDCFDISDRPLEGVDVIIIYEANGLVRRLISDGTGTASDTQPLEDITDEKGEIPFGFDGPNSLKVLGEEVCVGKPRIDFYFSDKSKITVFAVPYAAENCNPGRIDAHHKGIPSGPQGILFHRDMVRNGRRQILMGR